RARWYAARATSSRSPTRGCSERWSTTSISAGATSTSTAATTAVTTRTVPRGSTHEPDPSLGPVGAPSAPAPAGPSWPRPTAAPPRPAVCRLGRPVAPRRRTPEALHARGIGALAAFALLAVATTFPLPPAALEYVSPAAARLYRDMLPGWPDAPGWSVWRPLAL